MLQKKKQVEGIKIVREKTILEGMQQLNDTASQILLVVDDDGKLFGSLTDGDIRRAIGDGKPLQTCVGEICNTSPKTLSRYSKEAALRLMEEFSISRIPVVDSNGVPIAVVSMTDILPEEDEAVRENKVVIMAGGRGSRLDPITRIVPKPLLPVGDKPMLELIMESFAKCGFSEFLLSINYRKDFIKTYLAERSDLPFSISCIEEDTFLGTAGSLALMKEKLTETFFVSNCDILVDVNYISALEFHEENECASTMVGALKKVSVPYGVIHLRNGEFDRIEEKPDVPLIVNTGVYLLEPSCIDLIGRDEKLDMPDLIERIRREGGKVGVFPVHRKWIDIGQWGEYKQALE